MNNFDCCKTKSFPNSYFICVNCVKVYHRSCVLKDKTKYSFVEGYKIKCCEKSESVEILMQEKSILEDTISELSEDTLAREQHLNKLKQDHNKFIEEVTIREGELNAYIKKQEENLQKANQDMEKLRNDILLLKQKPTSAKATQTMTNNLVEHHTQTELSMRVDQSSQQRPRCYKQSKSNNIERKKLLLITGNHGREMAPLLSRFTDNFSISSIIKPNATSCEVLQTAISFTKSFTKKDLLILWPDEDSDHIYQCMSTHLSNTNFLILTTPNRFDYPNMNQKIYQDNLSLYKKVHAMKGNLNCVIDVNNILKRSNYGLGGYYIRRIGKRYIAAHLANRIEKREHYQPVIEKIDNCTQNNIINANGIIRPGNEKNRTYSQVTETSQNLAEELGLQNNPFLYPRLSQVAPQD